MKTSQLIEGLKEAIEREGDIEVFLEIVVAGRRGKQALSDILIGRNVLLVSQEAMDDNPLLKLPIVEREIH